MVVVYAAKDSSGAFVLADQANDSNLYDETTVGKIVILVGLWKKETPVAKIKVGVQFHPQHTTWASFAEAVKQAEALGVDSVWNWDHFYPLYGEKDGPHYEGWTTLTGMAMLTERVEVGCLVTCNSYRNANLLADMARTLDHMSNGRLILGIGAGWFERDYTEYGYEFGDAPGRLRALRSSLPVIVDRWSKLNPTPMRKIPILIGGGGEKVTLKLTAQYADIWHGFGPVETFQHKVGILKNWCKEIGRDPSTIELSVSPRENDSFDAYAEAGATHIIIGMGEPWDIKAIEALVAWRENRAS
jgi:probable F420-dependent oxidoreductase